MLLSHAKLKEVEKEIRTCIDSIREGLHEGIADGIYVELDMDLKLTVGEVEVTETKIVFPITGAIVLTAYED